MSEYSELNEELQKLMPMNEMSMAWVDKQANKCVWVENPNTHNNDYFKYYNSFSYYKADEVARISLTEPKYLEHRNLDGKKTWKLNNREKKELVALMNSPSNIRKGFTRWQITIMQYNFDNFYIDHEDTIAGTFDKSKYPDALDIDTPMPNYLELS